MAVHHLLHVHSLCAVVLDHFLADTVLQLMVQPTVILCHFNVFHWRCP